MGRRGPVFSKPATPDLSVRTWENTSVVVDRSLL